jgi:hypothetical protein
MRSMQAIKCCGAVLSLQRLLAKTAVTLQRVNVEPVATQYKLLIPCPGIMKHIPKNDTNCREMYVPQCQNYIYFVVVVFFKNWCVSRAVIYRTCGRQIRSARELCSACAIKRT